MLILASNSPRRKQLINLGGWSFSVHPVDIDEGMIDGERPDAYVLRLSREKAQAARVSLSLNPVFPNEATTLQEIEQSIIISADTAVVMGLDGIDRDPDGQFAVPQNLDQTPAAQVQILGKPADAVDAERILRGLRGRTHQVYSGLTVLRTIDGKIFSAVCITDVLMREYSDQEMRSYIASGDAFDKAGAYAIQHTGFHPVQKLHGCFANVMGLPLCHLSVLLRNFDLSMLADIAAACHQEFNYLCPISRLVLGEHIG